MTHSTLGAIMRCPRCRQWVDAPVGTTSCDTSNLRCYTTCGCRWYGVAGPDIRGIGTVEILIAVVDEALSLGGAKWKSH